MEIICALLLVYMIVLVLRAILSWFPIRAESGWSSVYALIYDVTEPVLAPMRRVIPPIGIFDLSFLILFIGIQIVRSQLCG